MWKATDPRIDEENRDKKRCKVVVTNGTFATVAHCEMNHGWQISMDMMIDGITFLGDKPDWPEHWRWTKLPSIKE